MFSKRKNAAANAVKRMDPTLISQILQYISQMEGVTPVAIRQNEVGDVGGGILEHLPPTRFLTHDAKTLRCFNESTNDHAVLQLSETVLNQVKTQVKKKAHLVTPFLAINHDALLEYFELSYATRVDLQVFCGAKVRKRARNWFEVVVQSEHPEEFAGDVAPTMDAVAMDFLKAVAAEGLSDHKVCWNDTNYVQYDPNEQVVPSGEEKEDIVSAVEEVFEEETTSKHVSGEEDDEEEESGEGEEEESSEEEEESSEESSEEESSGEEEDDDAVLQDDQSDEVVDMQEETTSKTDVVVGEDATNAQVKELASEVSSKPVSSKKRKLRDPLSKTSGWVNKAPLRPKRQRIERDFFHNL